MFDIGLQEMLVIGVLALLVFGPSKLPELGRMVGRLMREFRRASDEFRSTVETNLNMNDLDPPPVSDVAAPSTVDATPVSRHVVVAYDDEWSVEFLGERARPWWRRNGADAAAMLAAAEADYAKLTKESEAYDAALMKDLQQRGGAAYARVAALAFRQTLAAHKLVANKTFGWSRLFADLEHVLPSSVAASRIAVENVYQDGDRVKASLDFAVIARDFPSVQAMLQNMDNSGLFRAELRGQDLQKNERITFTEYTFHVIYTPAYGYTPAPTSDVAQNQGGMQ